jgi:chorismate mutase
MDHRETGSVASTDDEIALIRERIDRIDEQLVGLLAARYAATLAALSLKRSRGLPARDLDREQAIAHRAETLATGTLPSGVARKLILVIVDVLRKEAHFALGWYARN